MQPYFIIGTDTDCGKTYVTCAFMRYLQANHHSVMALKPVASGCVEREGQWVSDDALCLQACNEDADTMHAIDTICPWPLGLAVSPHLAAKAVGVELSAKAITEFCTDQAWSAFDYVLIEGAGGLMVPLNDTETWVDVLQRSQIPVILVVGMRLGCINHALLTRAALETYTIHCAGWVANCLDNTMVLLDETMDTLVKKISQPLLGIVAYGSEFHACKDWT